MTTARTNSEIGTKTLVNKPAGTKFKQQKLPAWQPILTASTVLPMLLAVGLSFIPLGIAFIVVTNAVREKTVDYTNCHSIDYPNVTCAEVINNNISVKCQCLVAINLATDFPSPVYMYYGLKSFYQNHRRYVKSRDDNQLMGDDISSVSDDCKPFNVDGNNKMYAPCGAIANSLFNDSFSLLYENESAGINKTEVIILQEGIAWKTDLETKFKNPKGYNVSSPDDAFKNFVKPPYWSVNVSQLNPKNPLYSGYRSEALIVWMRTAAFPSFRKLYGRVDHSKGYFINGLKAGNYSLIVNYNYPVTRFQGSKKIVLTTTSFLGGKNSFLGIAYLVVGSLSLLIGLVFLIIHIRVGKKTEGSMQMPISKSTPYFDTTMSDLLQSRMSSF